jgi:hypothetical protein
MTVEPLAGAKTKVTRVARRLGRRLRNALRGGESGQSFLEFIMVFPLMMLLFLLIGTQAWWWWNQTSAAVAIHDGTMAAAHHGGSTEAGYEETFRALAVPLGGGATDYVGTVHIEHHDGMRATIGQIDNRKVIELPLLGEQVFHVRAFSFLRWEQFYGGPPEYWE